MNILLATTNRHKVAEYRRLFAGSAFNVLSPDELGVEALDVPELGATFLANATTKAQEYVQAYRMACLADDSGICADALGGAPSIRSTRFGSPRLDDRGRMLYLVECLKNIPPAERGAHYVCALVLARPDHALCATEGRLYGRVAFAPSNGTTGFGYDPVFLVPRYGKVVADLTPDEKDTISHRGIAVRRLLAILAHEG